MTETSVGHNSHCRDGALSTNKWQNRNVKTLLGSLRQRERRVHSWGGKVAPPKPPKAPMKKGPAKWLQLQATFVSEVVWRPMACRFRDFQALEPHFPCISHSVLRDV
jgi:hypothetical protein